MSKKESKCKDLVNEAILTGFRIVLENEEENVEAFDNQTIILLNLCLILKPVLTKRVNRYVEDIIDEYKDAEIGLTFKPLRSEKELR